MAEKNSNATAGAGGSECFEATHWSVVLSAGDLQSPRAQQALAQLCQTYWYPLYVFVQRQGQNPENAKDIVQGFFATLIEKNYVAGAEPEKGRFRSFLLLALKRYMANEWDRARREKRGGKHEFVSLDEQTTGFQSRLELTDGLSPEKAFERQWALTLLQKVLDRLSAEFAAAGKEKLFAELKVFLSGEKGGSYAEIGARLGMSESAIKVAVHRLRRRYLELLRLEIANTVRQPEAVDDEIRNLFAALS